MTPSRLLAFVFASVALTLLVSPLQGLVTFTAPELLGRPTSNSITVNVVAGTAIDAYFEYGTQPGTYTNQTNVQSAAANEPLVAVIDGLQSDTSYFYRMMYRETGTSPWLARDEHTFHTARAPGATFTFTITSDSHINNVFGDPALWQRTLNNVNGDHPDFHLDLGDTFGMDSVVTLADARSVYLTQRPYFGLIGHSAPVFLVLGNHEDEEGWHRDDTGDITTSRPILGAMARKRYFLNPAPNAFYSGNTDAWPVLGGDQLPVDYYAFEWGDALFIAIDPYWYTTTKPFTGNMGGGEGSDPGSGDRWDWTLGRTQYDWLKQTLENSHAKYKFMFAHHGTGGTDDYIRGGANAVPFNEWGGRNEDGVTDAFATRRPGWYAPVHQLLVENHLTAFFHGHDHEYAHEQRDGVVYQEVPMGAESGYGFGFQLYHETDPYTIRVLPNSGHLRVTVTPASATVEYVRAFLPGDGTNGQIADSYSMSGSSGTPNTAPTIVTPASATPSPVPGTTTALSALGADDGGEPALTYTWATTGTPPAAVAFSANGTNAARNSIATFAKAGAYTLQLTIRDAGNLTVTSSVSVTVSQTLTTVTVSPATASVVAGGSQLFAATARDQFGAALTAQPSMTWAVAGGGTIGATGQFTAGGVPGGPFQVTATTAGIAGNASVTVTIVAPVSIAYVQGAGTTSGSGATTIAQAFSTVVTAGDLIVAAASWGNNGALSCSDSQANTYTVATSQYDSVNNQSMGICFAPNAKAGATTVTAAFSSAASDRRLLIHQYRGIASVAPMDVVAKNLANGTTAANAITSTAVATTANGDLIFGAVMDDAGVTGITAGTGFTQRLSVNNKDLVSEDLVQANAGSIAATQTFGASHRYLAQMVAFKAAAAGLPNAAPTVAVAAAATPATVTGTSTSLSVLGADDSAEANLTYTWATTGTPPAAVSFNVNGTNAAKNLIATFVKSGTYNIQATIKDAGNLTVTSAVSVTVNQTLTVIVVAPSSASVAAGATRLFSASANDQFGVALAAQPSIDWTVSGGGSISAAGLFTAGASAGGPFTVTAASAGIQGSASVTVTPVNGAPTVAIAASALPNPVTGTSTTLSALGADDGGEANLVYTWATTGAPPAAVSFSVNGTNAAKNAVATFTMSGTYSFLVTIKDAGNLTVTSPVTVSVTIPQPIGIGFVQSAGLTNDAASTTAALAFTTATAAGNLVIAAVSWGNNATVTCSDSQGNAYAVVTSQFDSANNQSLAICYAANVKSGPNTVTASFSSSPQYRRLLIHEYRGVALAGAVDVSAKNLANGTTTANAITSTAAVSTVSGALIFGAVMDDAGVNNISAGAGFTLRQSVNNRDLVSEDRVQAAAGSIAATFTFSTAHRYLAQLVIFKPAF